jgi:putative GTP pyrophosphokinase
MTHQFTDRELKKLNEVLLVYERGQTEFIKKLQNHLSNNLATQSIDMIEDIKSRIKSQSSIGKKLHNLRLELTAENAATHLTDIAGIRIICSFTKDTYSISELLKSIPGIRIIAEKDYIKSPKPSGYRCLHIILGISIYYSGKLYDIPIEVQIRTAAMDFWASLEHKVQYKFENHIPQRLSEELALCADQISELGNRMFLIHEIVWLLNQNSPSR